MPTHSGEAAAPALAWTIDAYNMDCLFVLSAAAAEEFIASPVRARCSASGSVSERLKIRVGVRVRVWVRVRVRGVEKLIV